MLLCIGPVIDQGITKQWVLDYVWTEPALLQLVLSCGLAVLVNISQFMCLGRFSAVCFQVGGSFGPAGLMCRGPAGGPQGCSVGAGCRTHDIASSQVCVCKL
jgi:hypothetical protein